MACSGGYGHSYAHKAGLLGLSPLDEDLRYYLKSPAAPPSFSPRSLCLSFLSCPFSYTFDACLFLHTGIPTYMQGWTTVS